MAWRGALAVVVTLALSPALAAAQTLATAPPLDLRLARLGGGLLLFALLAVAAAVYVKRFTSGRGGMLPKAWLAAQNQRLTVIETRRLSPHADVCRLSADGREYLVVVGPGGTTVLREREHACADEAKP